MTTADLQRTERYLAHDPQNPLLLAEAVDTALSLGLVDKARRHVDAAMRMASNDAFMRNRHGNVLLAEGRLEEAEAVFAELIQHERNANIAHNLASVYLRTARPAQAREVLAPYMTAPDAPAAAVTTYLRALHHLGDTAQALEAANAHLPRCGGDPQFLAVASLIALDEGRLQEASQWSSAALAGSARPMEALVAAGSHALAREDVQKARAFFKEVLAKHPTEGRSLAGLGTASLLLGDARTASEHFASALAAMPGNSEILQSLGWSLVMQGQTRAAEDAFRSAAAVDPETSEPLGGLAAVCAVEGRRAEAEGYISQAHRLDPQDAGAKLARAILSGEATDRGKLQALVIRSRGS